MSRIRISALCMLLAAPFVLGIDGAVVCVCSSGPHLDAPHAGACRSGCGTECAPSESCETPGMCAHDTRCVDIPLAGPGMLLTRGDSAKKAGAPVQHVGTLQSLAGCALPAPLTPRQAHRFPLDGTRSCILLI